MQCPHEARTCNPSISSQAPYHRAPTNVLKKLILKYVYTNKSMKKLIEACIVKFFIHAMALQNNEILKDYKKSDLQ